MSIEYKTIRYRFGQKDTIRAVVRKLNYQDMAPFMLDKLMDRYNELNGNRVPKMGEEVEIPIFIGFLGLDKKTI